MVDVTAHPHIISPGNGRYAGFYRKNGVVEPLPYDDDAIRTALADPEGVVWIDLQIAGDDDARILRDIFKFHPLAVEDSVSVRVDPAKIDDYGEYIFVVVQALTECLPNEELEAIEVDFYLGKNYLVSTRREPVPAIDAFIVRFQRCELLLRRTSDWVLHGLMDALVDDYLPIVDTLDETIDRIEAEVLEHAEPHLLQQILIAKRNSLRLRRATAPQRDIMNRLARAEFPALVREETSIYFRDIYDHLVRVEYLIEAVRDLSDGALQTYLSVVSNRMNEIMKVLTAAATLFLPLTVVTGVYGMNFEDNQFPSFGANWGFAAVIAFMALNSIVMLSYFRYRRWI